MNIQKNRLYRIVEKPGNTTPDALRKAGRFKMVAHTAEPARCLYRGTIENGVYDTGFEESSLDFRNKDPKEVKKILKEREELANYFKIRKEQYLKSHPDKTENDFIAGIGIDMSHNQVIDTSDMETYLKLYLALRGGKMTPEDDKFNPIYNSSLYMLIDSEGTDELAESYATKKLEAMTWFGTTLKEKPDTLKEYLRYVGAISISRTVSNRVLIDVFEKFISDSTKLDELLRVKNEVDLEKVTIINKIRLLRSKRKIVKENGIWYYGNTELGKTDYQIYETLMKDGNENILQKFIEDK